ncbi:5'-nucleotidase C-terminal domain-containing protein [Cytobacillus gottheilii]|uniref:5'-nucleotidase C-terminal domain-containing protein n=1 Tax=Cytobacillus gottheilii TaxID=859144 RepID=A0ABX8FIP1_9BACI|nr:5'-nucleotidase C-terminal domain-containing protein [Cytobacillus gottheilii]QVY63894.1 5'-nucleotidase C-terminal domain-containing protein [Cytobacillus gottheilii]
MHNNDSHAHLDDVAKFVTAVKGVRADKPEALLLNAGDVFSGTLYFNEFQGQADLDFMNLLGYDAMTFGNHEFDLGSNEEGHKALADFIKGAQFPFVSSNIDFSADDNLKGLFSDLQSSDPENGRIYNGIIKEVDGEKVGIFGLTTAETADISSPGDVKFEDYIEEAEKAVKAFEDKGVDKIIALTHIGYDDNPAYDNDLTLAAAVDGIDVIVGGHSHTKLDNPVVIDKNENGQAKEPTIIVQGQEYHKYLGTLDVTFDENGVVVEHDGELIDVADFAEDAQALEMLKPYKDRVDEVSNTEIGATATEALENPRTNGDNTKESVRKNETVLGNLITDGMLAKAREYKPEDHVIMALQNGGGIRAGIDAGPITNGDVITVLPFGNTLATMSITGAELKQAFEISLGNLPGENGGFLHVSGGKVEYDSSKPAGERVVSVSYKNEQGEYIEVQDAEEYVVATNAFTAKGGDGYDVFEKIYQEGRVTDLGLSDWENFAEHLQSLGTVSGEIEGRIIDVLVKEVPAADFSGTTEEPKQYKGNVTVDTTNIDSLSNAVVNGDLVLTGTPSEEATFSNITVTGNLDLSDFGGDVILDGITVEGETIL